MRPTITEHYVGYAPPPWVLPTVERLLASSPESAVRDLDTVVLTNESQANRQGRRASRRNRTRTRLGSYAPASHGNRAFIQLRVDAILRDLPKPLDEIQIYRDMVLSYVLYHEMGHHLAGAVGTIRRTGEATAEAWGFKLFCRHFDRLYPHAPRLIPLLNCILKVERNGGSSGTYRLEPLRG